MFGLFPITIDSKNPQDITFKWRSCRTFFSIFFVVVSALTSCSVLKLQTEKGPLTASNIVGIVFVSSCCIICTLFFKISQNFKVVMIKWMETEAYLTVADYPLSSRSRLLKKEILFCTFLYIFLATLEHALYQSSAIYKFYYDISVCKPLKIDVVEAYIKHELESMIIIWPFSYSHFIGILFEYSNLSFTFFWSFLDLFIILISIGISFLFEKLNERLYNYKGLLVNESVWAEIRFIM